jgi:hypothetical protein
MLVIGMLGNINYYIIDFHIFFSREMRRNTILMSRVLLENLAAAQLVRKFSAMYGTRKYVTMSTKAPHRALS